MKKNKLIRICLLISCLALVGCDDETHSISNNGELHDSSNWYSETELEKVHLPNLKAPMNCTGEMSTSTTWFNEGYSFYQPCPSEEVMIRFIIIFPMMTLLKHIEVIIHLLYINSIMLLIQHLEMMAI